MEDAFTPLLWVVAAVGALIAIVTLVNTARTYREIGGGMVRDGGSQAPADESAAEREEEIRQLLEARNARRARRGEAPQDVAAELAALARPAADPALREELRQLVIAHNRRRARRGDPPLDVDEETERRLGELK